MVLHPTKVGIDENTTKVVLQSSADKFILLSKNFSKWVLCANGFAWPLAYFAGRIWLQNYPFRTNISFWIFIISTGIALGVALLTMSYHSVRAATANPIHSLRYE